MVGLLLPNIELVLGLVGSTIGTIICLLLPALMFTRLAQKYSSERLVAQVSGFG
jgi:solute carrier family 38 (sodium-coupled neutral amino acid transporter), member 10